MRVLLISGHALLWLLVACEGSQERRQASAPADTITVDRQRCILPSGLSPSDSAAVRCAELFVARNGYTDLPPHPDSSHWVGEFMDLGMEHRHDTLERRAVALCRGDDVELPAYRVIFRRTEGEGARAVGLKADLSHMAIMHQDAAIPSGSDLGGSCVLLHR